LAAVVAPKAVTATSEVPIALASGMPVASISPGTMRKPPPMPKKPDNAPHREADRQQQRQQLPRGGEVQAHVGVPLGILPENITVPTTTIRTPNSARSCSPGILMASDDPATSACDARCGEGHGAGPFHLSAARMVRQVGECGERHRDGAGADRQVRRAYAHHIKQQRHGDDRSAPAHEPRTNPTRLPEAPERMS
jgi:hypothetical protein